VDDTVPVPIRVDPAWFRPVQPPPSAPAPPAIDVDTTLGLGAKVVVGPALPFQRAQAQAPPVLPAPSPAAPRVDTGTLWLDRGAAPPAHAPGPPQTAAPARPTVALSGSSGPVAPFTLAPSQAPLAPSTPFRPLALDEFARIVVTLERGWDPTPLLGASGLTMRDWAAISRDMFRRSMSDAPFARDLELALDRARRGVR
jgi:hypothetical protein